MVFDFLSKVSLFGIKLSKINLRIFLKNKKQWSASVIKSLKSLAVVENVKIRGLCFIKIATLLIQNLLNLKFSKVMSFYIVRVWD